ncbi:hypothetical protein DEU56DRAFT_508376 [Suillus clintonianus]|uniref:uncharacterized protein n=1 Tax=Suillus clintonianus TaxID=1904413 RepID=UPI001B860179|nr:uncharacterized protein DEU56DRAFT_508376 [Suillus clintonianus]KAG2128593.1 hypothetical protein DEU56DRAFT_508376 [Suillus clintonianus]
MGSPRKESNLKGINDGGDAPRRTVGEVAREKRLRDDPMAEVLGPLFVTCKRCGNRIKLSPKSLYDPFHWLKHRERCLKKPVGGARPTNRPSRESIKVEKHSSASSSNTDADNLTPPPPLTPNDDQRGIPAVFKEGSSSPEPEEMVIDTLTKVADLPLVDHGPWQSWSWSDLRPPAWLVDTNPMLEDDGDDDEPPRVTIIERGPTPTLSPHPSARPEDHP